MSFLGLIAFLAVLGLLVLVHEWGHYIVAKLVGMRVDEFSIGFPPRIFQFKRGETNFVIGALPLGGYVKIHGEGDESDASDPRSFSSRPVWARIAVLLAGVTMNIVLAVVLLAAAFTQGFPSLSQDLSTYRWSKTVPGEVFAGGIAENLPAEVAGIKVGDRLVEGTATLGERQIVSQFATRGEVLAFGREAQDALNRGEVVSVVLTVERDGAEEVKVITPQAEGPAFGIQLGSTEQVKLAIWNAPLAAIREVGAIVVYTWDSLGDFFGRLFRTGTLDPNVSGPIGIYRATSEAAATGFASVVFLTVLLSVNLAVINLMPVPALDGGKIIFQLIELFAGKRVISHKIEQYVTAAGFFVLIAFMLVLTVRDIFL